MSDLRNAIAQVLTNSANYPSGLQPYIAGRDMSGLIDAVTKAVEATHAKPLDPEPYFFWSDVPHPRPGYEQDRSKYA